jgi:hypothetical protein
MSDTTPAAAPPPPPATSGWGPKGKVRDPLAVVIFWFITLGIYYFVWSYKVFKENKEFSGEGIGGGIGLLLAILINIVNWFLLPAEIGNIYAKLGREKPVSGVTGFWNFIPLIGWIIWGFKVQNAMNRMYE